MPSCAVRHCSSGTPSKYSEPVIFFSFPHNEKIAEEWVKFCGYPDLNISNSTICSKHFEDSCFIDDQRDEITYSSNILRKIIKRDAIPTIGGGQTLKDTITNVVCEFEPTISETIEPLKIPESSSRLTVNPTGTPPPFEKIFVKNPFFINFKDNSGAFLNEIRNQPQNCDPEVINSDKPSILEEYIRSGNITEDYLSKNNYTYPLNDINHDHDYTKTYGPELRNDKGNIFLTVNLTEYSKVIDVKRICGIVLVLNDQPTQNSKNNASTNDTHGSDNGYTVESVSGSDPIDVVRKEGKSISINKKKRKKKDEVTLGEHFQINEKGEKEFNCPKCEKRYYSPRGLRHHFQKVHDASYKYKCSKCSKVYKAYNVLTNHMKREHFIPCQFCENKYETAPQYKTHLKEDHKEVPYNLCKPYFCEVCDKEFTSKSEFLKHLRLHGGNLCGICAERFDTREELAAHEETHPNKYVCEICNKGFKERHSLTAHKEVHNDRIFVCTICQQGFKGKGTLRNHVMTHRNEKRFLCDKCPIRCYNPSRLAMHQRTVHDKLRPYKCHECEKSFSTTSTLHLHHRIVHLKLKPFQCEFCGRQFSKKDNFINHRNIHIGIPRKKRLRKNPSTELIRCVRNSAERKRWDPVKNSPIDCETCGKTLKNLASWKAHLNTHVRIRKYKCNFCGLLFLHQTSKIRHEKAHEADPEHKFVCPVCWKRMKTKEELDIHTKQHNNRVRRHKCDICEETFCRRLLLDNHLLLEHTDPGDAIKKGQELDGVFNAANNLSDL